MGVDERRSGARRPAWIERFARAPGEPNRPPWRGIAAMVAVGGVALLAAWLLDAPWLYVVGEIALLVVPLLLLLPVLRTSAGRPGSRRDANFIGGGMHVAGLSVDEIDAATERARPSDEAPAGDEPPAAAQRGR